MTATKIGPPLWLLAELTYRCPLHCVFCYNPVDYARTGPELSTDDWQRVEEMAATRYNLWSWNVGRSPQFNVQKSARLPAGQVDARIEVEEGRIASIRLFGDFSGKLDVAGLEAHLVGVPYDRQRLTAALADLDLNSYFGQMDTATFIDLLY